MDQGIKNDWTLGDEGFVKIYGDRLVGSSLMDEDIGTRWLFVFLLAASDMEGRFHCQSVKRLAALAGMSDAEAQKAVHALESPDPRSTTRDHDGRRIERVEGGWIVLNKAKFAAHRSKRQLADAERKRQQREREKQKSAEPEEEF